MRINTSDISIIVQGAVDPKNTPLCLAGIRKHLPGAEIILSTWEGTNVSGLTYDKLLLNKDPGGHQDKGNRFFNNLNRQIVSSFAGLKESHRKYCMKLRSDIVFTSSNFLKFVDKFPIRRNDAVFFHERVIFCSYFFKKYVGEVTNEFSGVMPTPFHISDWLMFGLREDLTKLFDIELADEPQNTDYFYYLTPQTIRRNLLGCSHRYVPEQYILYSALKKHSTLSKLPNYDSVLHYDSHNMAYYEEFVANNCIILDAYQLSIYCAKADGADPYKSWTKNYLRQPYLLYEGLYHHLEFLRDYIKYCDPQYRIPSSVIFRDTLYQKFHRFF